MENKQGKSSLRKFIKDFNSEFLKDAEYVTYHPRIKIYNPSEGISKYVVIKASKLQTELNNIVNSVTAELHNELELKRKLVLKDGCIPDVENDLFLFKEDYLIFKMNWGLEDSKIKCPKCGERIKRLKRWKCGKCGASYKT